MSSILRLMIVIFAVALSTFAHPPTGIVVDQNGIVYFSDLVTIWKLDPNGRVSVFRPGVGGRHVHELAIDKDGNLFGDDIGYESEKWVGNVWSMTSEGKLTNLIEPTRNPPRGASPYMDAAGNMYVIEQDNHTRKQTLLLRRTPTGEVTTFAGGLYGYRDGKGTEARFSSVGGMFIDSDSAIYLTDGKSLRKVSTDGVVTTIATDLTKRTSTDGPMLFGKNDGIVSGLAVDSNGNIFVADAGNQRLLKVNSSGKMEVVYRGEEPYYPNGVAISNSGDLYVLEVGFVPPSTSLPARVRKITTSGQSSIVATSGELTANPGVHFAEATFRKRSVPLYLLALAGVAVIGISITAWQLTRRMRRG